MRPQTDPDCFSLGLCMAGAISAGAYSAGVMDYLMQALQQWELARNQPGVPRHRVVLRVVGGASAGGMNTLVTAAALADPPTDTSGELFGSHHQFFNTWVNMLDDDMMPRLLDAADLERGPATSLLNSDFIEMLADKVLDIDPQKISDHPFVDRELELFMTMSNVNGIPYELGFRSNVAAGEWYRTRAHDDIAHFRMNVTDYRNDGRIPLSFVPRTHLALAKACAVATGAFPLGLRAQIVTREGKYLQDNPYINRNYPNALPRLPEGSAAFLQVDGGLINNEPFEITRNILLEKTGEDEACRIAAQQGLGDPNKNHHHFRSTVLMVDPFPTEDAEPGSISPNLLSMVGHVYNTMRSQLLFKADDIEAAMNEDDYSRFMIAPKREVNGQRIQGARAIASGSLGGFGGFLDRRFRLHDFLLGRRNCQRFLKENFTVPAVTQNEIFRFGYADVPAPAFRNARGDYQIIPVVNAETGPSEEAVWPSVRPEMVNRYRGAIKERMEKVAFSLMTDVGWVNRVLARIGSRVLLRRTATQYIIERMKTDLIRHQLTGR